MVLDQDNKEFLVTRNPKTVLMSAQFVGCSRWSVYDHTCRFAGLG